MFKNVSSVFFLKKKKKFCLSYFTLEVLLSLLSPPTIGNHAFILFFFPSCMLEVWAPLPYPPSAPGWVLQMQVPRWRCQSLGRWTQAELSSVCFQPWNRKLFLETNSSTFCFPLTSSLVISTAEIIFLPRYLSHLFSNGHNYIFFSTPSLKLQIIHPHMTAPFIRCLHIYADVSFTGCCGFPRNPHQPFSSLAAVACLCTRPLKAGF